MSLSGRVSVTAHRSAALAYRARDRGDRDTGRQTRANQQPAAVPRPLRIFAREDVDRRRRGRFKSVKAAASLAIYVLAGEDPQAPRYSSRLLVRTSLPAGIAISATTRAIRESGAPMSVTEARPLSDIVSV